jgi:diguanylate cyclase (GGDEF)-like protein/PAS domain S-box-containing protein
MSKPNLISAYRTALARVAANRAPPGPERAPQEVLDRLGPSVFAGLLDADGTLRYANQAALRAIGSTPEQVLGQPFEVTPWWQGRESSQRRLRQALVDAARGEASRFDVRIATRGGDTLVLDFSLLPLCGPDGPRFHDALRPILARAGRGVRAFGEMIARLCAQARPHHAIREDELWNELGRRERFFLFCAYPSSASEGDSDASRFLRVFELHARSPAANNAQDHSGQDAHFRRLTELSSSDWYWEQDETGRFTEISGRNLERASIFAPDILGRTRWELAGARASEAQKVLLERTIRERRPFYDFGYSFTGSDGVEHHVETSGEPVFDTAGRFRGYRGVGRDVTERERARRQLLLTRHAVEQAHHALFQVGPDGAFRDANGAACRLLGLTREQVLRLRVPDVDTQMVNAQWPLRWREMCERGSLRFETSVRHHDGHEIPVDVSVSLVTSGDETFAHVCVDDLRERRAAERRIQQLLQHDELTGLPNRRLLFERLGATLQTSAETLVLVLELDRFKRINDGLGPQIGDAALREVAQRIVATVRSGDLVSRCGGDEFVIVMPAPSAAPMHTAQALLDTIARPMTIEGNEIHLTCSVGIAVAPANGNSAFTLLRRANAALHQAKLQGRNQVSVYAGAPHDDDPERLALETALRHALRDEQFELHYQPQVDLGAGHIVGVEALLRWQHPTLGRIAPNRFIPIAEETGLILAIGDWVLRRAIEQAAAWQRAGLPHLRMAVNLSARQLLQPDLARRIEGLLAATGLDPRLFGVEVTESMLIANFDQAVQHLQALRALGVEVSLDDFGTGYSSLSYLRRLPIDVVKIDRSLVPDVTAPAEDVSITRAIITMAHQLQMKALAEGVESEGQAALLAANQCDQMQGYWFSAALPAAAVETMLREDRRIDPGLFGQRSRQRTLLLVDDEENIVAALRRLLRGEGWLLLSATSAEQALQLMARHEVDVILSDQRMPGMTGVELLRRAKQLYPETIRLVLSGYTELQSITDAINEGAIYKFLTKPWDDVQLRVHLHEAFAMKEMADQNRRLDQEVQTANRELAELNRRQQTLLNAQREQNQREVGRREAAQELLDAVPVPVFGIDDEGLLVFANASATALDGQGGDLLGGPAADRLPQTLLQALDSDPMLITLAERRWWAMSRRLSGSARGRLLVLLPQEGTLQ